MDRVVMMGAVTRAGLLWQAVRCLWSDQSAGKGTKKGLVMAGVLQDKGNG